MIKFSDCDFCKNCVGIKRGHPVCKAFPDGVPYEHMEKDLKSNKNCNNGIGYEPKEDESDFTTL